MMGFLRQHPNHSEQMLHQVCLEVLQRHTFLDIWDSLALENKVKKADFGVEYAFQEIEEMIDSQIGHEGLEAIAEILKFFIRFSPLISEGIKSGKITKRINKLIKELKTALRSHIKNSKSNVDTTREKKIKLIASNEINHIQKDMQGQVRKRVMKIIKISNKMISEEFNNEITENCLFDPFEEQLEDAILNACPDEDLTVTPSDFNEECEQNMIRLLQNTRNPDIFAHTIKEHAVTLTPEFVIPALETQMKRMIILKNTDGTLVGNIQHQSENDPITVFQDQFGYTTNTERFTPSEHGKNCLIIAIQGSEELFKAGIASVCKQKNHPCYEYIMCGIAHRMVT